MTPRDLLPFAYLAVTALWVGYALLRKFVTLCELDSLLGPAFWLFGISAAWVGTVLLSLRLGLLWVTK